MTVGERTRRRAFEEGKRVYAALDQDITYQKSRPGCGHFASGVRLRAPTSASTLRPLCVCGRPQLRKCVYVASAGARKCVYVASAGDRTQEIFIYRYRQQTSCLADFVGTNESLLNALQLVNIDSTAKFQRGPILLSHLPCSLRT